MSTNSTAKSALPYARRLAEDQYVQEQLRDAVVGLRGVFKRVAREREQAAQDKKVYSSLRNAATSLRNATIALREPEPPPKHRVRKVLIIALAVTGTSLLVRFASQQQESQLAAGPGDAAGTGSSPGNESAPPETATANP